MTAELRELREGNYLTNRAISTTARQQATTTTTGMYPFLPCPDPDTELMRVVCFCCSSLFLRDPVTCDICGITYGAKDTAVNATGSTAGCTMISFLVLVFTFHTKNPSILLVFELNNRELQVHFLPVCTFCICHE